MHTPTIRRKPDRVLLALRRRTAVQARGAPPISRALSGLRRRYSGCSAVRGGDQRTKQPCKLDIGPRPRAKPLLVWGCSNDLELPVEAATQQELRPPRVIGRGHHDNRTPSSSRCQVADHAGLSSGRVRVWLGAQHFEPLAGCTQLVRGPPARIAAIGDDQHRCGLLVQQPEGLAEALTTATGEDHQGVGWMGGIGCGVDQDSRGDSPQPAEHEDHKPQAEDPAPWRPSAAAPDLACGCLPSAMAQQPRPPPPGSGGHKLHHEPSDRDPNGLRGGIAPGSPAAPDRSQVTVRSGRLQGGLDNNAARNPPACLTDRSPARRVRRWSTAPLCVDREDEQISHDHDHDHRRAL
jgi:hypothetical protein